MLFCETANNGLEKMVNSGLIIFSFPLIAIILIVAISLFVLSYIVGIIDRLLIK